MIILIFSSEIYQKWIINFTELPQPKNKKTKNINKNLQIFIKYHLETKLAELLCKWEKITKRQII